MCGRPGKDACSVVVSPRSRQTGGAQMIQASETHCFLRCRGNCWKYCSRTLRMIFGCHSEILYLTIWKREIAKRMPWPTMLYDLDRICFNPYLQGWPIKTVSEPGRIILLFSSRFWVKLGSTPKFILATKSDMGQKEFNIHLKTFGWTLDSKSQPVCVAGARDSPASQDTGSTVIWR